MSSGAEDPLEPAKAAALRDAGSARVPAVLDVPVAEPVAPAPTFPSCGNCGEPMYGSYCYRCGQPEKGMIRSLREVGSDLADIVFNVDSRIFRSIFDLYFRPGFLTTEYCAGRRVRYVTPFRLFFVLCVLSIFAVQVALEDQFVNSAIVVADDDRPPPVTDTAAGQAAAPTEAPKDSSAPGKGGPGKAGSDKAGSDKAGTDKAGTDKAGTDKAGTDKAGTKDGENDATAMERVFNAVFSFNGQPWDAKTNPVEVTWLPQAANRRINVALGHMLENTRMAARKPALLGTAMFSVLPQTLFVLMPLFAVLLKIVYIFKRRLYMEHLMVALHSHAFIFLSLLVLILLYALRDAAIGLPGVSTPIGWLIVAAWVWLPLYLLLMQKRVYRQGWIMGVLAYGVIGMCYSFLLSLGLVAALVVGMAVA